MSTARLVLKQPTGWFAAGREVAQAPQLLSDGAFKLYIHLCLEADRHTGRAVIEPAVLRQVLRKDPVSLESNLGELHLNKVCERRGNRIEICDRFWPYQKVGTGAADPEADFVRHVREAFLKPACVRSAFTAADEKLVLNLGRRGVGLEQVRRAIWLGCARKYVAMLNGQTRYHWPRPRMGLQRAHRAGKPLCHSIAPPTSARRQRAARASRSIRSSARNLLPIA